MKLTLQVIAYHLSAHYKYSLRIASRGESELGRPRFYEGPASKPGFLYILPAKNVDEPVDKGTYIGRSMPTMKHPQQTSVLVIEDDVPYSELYNRIQEIYDLYDNWEISSLSAVEKFQDYSTLLLQTWNAFHLPVMLVDAHYNVIASSHSKNTEYALFERNEVLDTEIVADLISNPRFRNLDQASGVTLLEMDQNYLINNFQYSGKYCGRLFMGQPTAESLCRDQLIAEHLSEWVEILLQRFGSFEATGTVQTYMHTFMLDVLNDKQPSDSELKYMEDTTGWSDRQMYLLVRFLPEHRLKKELYPPYLISQVEERWVGAVAAEYNEQVVMLLNVSEYGGTAKLADFYQSLAYLVRDGLMIAGCSRIFVGVRDLKTYYRQSGYALELGQSKDVTRWYFKFDDYSLDYLMQYGLGIFRPEQVCHPALLLLQEHDQEKQTSYFETLYTFFLERYNMSQTANRLYIHRSTLINRMERIEELCRLDLNDYDTRLYLAISFRLLTEQNQHHNLPFYL